MLTQNLGYPRIGAHRELKKACESYWAGRISNQELLDAGKSERQKNWQVQMDTGIDLIPCNDFSFYDHVLDMSLMLGAIPNHIGPGVYDIHSPRIPTVSEIEDLITEARKYIPKQNIWVNPDCGLKTRKWEEVTPALENIVSAAINLRNKIEPILK